MGDKVIYIPLPGFEARKRLFELYLIKGKPAASDIDPEELAREANKLSAADIKAACMEAENTALEEAMSRDEKEAVVTMAMALKAVKAQPRSVSDAELEQFKAFEASRMEK